MAHPYDPNWVKQKTRELEAAREAEKLFPLPGRVQLTDQNEVDQVDDTFRERRRHIEKSLKS